MATYAIGDIQGCMAPLRQLIELIRFDPSVDRLWFVGDLVNRGPESLAVLRYVRGLGDAAVTVLGNHELHLLALAAGVARPGRKDTVHDVLGAPDRTDLLSWLRQRPMAHREGEILLIHAGLLPQWTIPIATELAQEAEVALRGNGWRELLQGLYEGRLPDRWSDGLAGPARLGVVINALTKLRVCTAEGVMALSFKAEPERAPPGLLPWFRAPRRRSTDVTVVCGHWSALGLHLQDKIIAVDTGCVWGRPLTAVRLEDRQVFQVPGLEPTGGEGQDCQ
jgi:bis(5'-nucleosyl)-tetraphosphatase (symmetrical)